MIQKITQRMITVWAVLLGITILSFVLYSQNWNIISTKKIVQNDMFMDSDISKLQKSLENLMTTQIGTLNREIASFSKKQQQLTHQINDINQKLMSLDHGNPSMIEHPMMDLTEDEIIAEEEERLTQAFISLGNKFTAEPVDETWVVEAETQLIAKIESLDLQESNLLTAECHTTFCRIKLNHKDRAAMEKLFDGLLTNLGWNTDIQMMVTHDSVDSIETTLFMSRDDYPLPQSNL